MARLPQPGGDDGNWGTILNDFLAQAHNTDGSIKPDAVDATAIADATITEAKLSAAVQTKLNSSSGIVTWGNISGSLSSQTDIQNALNAKVDATTTVNGQTLSGNVALTKADIGLGNVDNTSDANKPISSATQTALNTKVDVTTLSNYIPTTQKGAPNGVASLDGSGQVPSTQLPTVLIPVTSVSSRTGDVVLSKNDVGLGNVDNTSDANKPISSATQSALNAKVADIRSITGTDSITGGGDLTIDRTLGLVGDAAAPGNSKYYGTDGTGMKGYHDLPVSAATTFSHSVIVSDPTVTNFMVWRAPYACTVTKVVAARTGGTSATINARKNGSSTHLATDLSLSTTGSFIDGGSVQNATYATNDYLEIMITGVAGGVTQLTIQVDFVVS